MNEQLLTMKKLKLGHSSEVMEKDDAPSIAVIPLVFGGFLSVVVLVGTADGINVKVSLHSLADLIIPEVDKTSPACAGELGVKQAGAGHGWGEVFRTFAQNARQRGA